MSCDIRVDVDVSVLVVRVSLAGDLGRMSGLEIKDIIFSVEFHDAVGQAKLQHCYSQPTIVIDPTIRPFVSKPARNGLFKMNAQGLTSIRNVVVRCAER